MTNKLVVIINSLKVAKIKKILLYEMKFLVPNYSCLQNPWLEGYRPQIPFLSVLCPQLNLLNSLPPKNCWIRHWTMEWINRRFGETKEVANTNRNKVQCPKLEWCLSTTAHCPFFCVRQVVFQVRLLYRARLGSVRIVTVCARNVPHSLPLLACKRCRM